MRYLFVLLTFIGFSSQAQITTFPWSEDFDDLTPVTNNPDFPSDWSIANNNDDNAYWDVLANSDLSPDNSHSAPNSMHMSFDPVNDADDWLFTPEFQFSAEGEYQLSFWYKNIDGGLGTVESLAVFLLSGTDPIQVSSVLFDDPQILAGDWALFEVAFVPPNSGVYQIGFQCYSAPFQFLLAVDDVMVTELSVSVEENEVQDLNVYPNPSNGILNLSVDHPVNLEVLDIAGRVIFEQQSVLGSFDLRHLPNGTYMVKAVAGSDVLLSRWVKE
ncbi:MAG: T9SS type A sorting domain-containing protein [Flavobacteriales bacterium]|nr:T9SS type A sorting domain-containing protein [Flavobacteriales bacterium]